jgi:hypothetical protein
MPKSLFRLALLLCFAAFAAQAQQPVPELRYDPPPNFYHSAIHPPEDFSANEFNAGLQAFHYYLFSASGRVYRAYDTLTVPGGDPNRFDFDAVERDDPGNSGRYAVKGNQLIIRIGGQPPETISVAMPASKRVTIDSVLYIRQ